MKNAKMMATGGMSKKGYAAGGMTARPIGPRGPLPINPGKPGTLIGGPRPMGPKGFGATDGGPSQGPMAGGPRPVAGVKPTTGGMTQAPLTKMAKGGMMKSKMMASGGVATKEKMKASGGAKPMAKKK